MQANAFQPGAPIERTCCQKFTDGLTTAAWVTFRVTRQVAVLGAQYAGILDQRGNLNWYGLVQTLPRYIPIVNRYLTPEAIGPFAYYVLGRRNPTVMETGQALGRQALGDARNQQCAIQ